MDLYSIRNELMQGKTIYDLSLVVTFYTRVSTSTADQLHSLKAQIDYFKDFITHNNNWTYIDGYIDEGLSGTSITKREAFNQMIDDGRNKKFDLILTKEVSRFARNTLDSLFYTRELLKYGVGVFYQNDNINTLYNDSELRLSIMSSIAQEESHKISDRIRWGHKRAIQNGKVLGNNKIWGYTKDKGKLVIDEEEAKIVKEIFSIYCQGYGIRTISTKLTEMGFTNHNNNPFNFTSIKNIIQNPKYKGYYVGNKISTIDYISRQQKELDKSEWIIYKDYDNVPPLVSEETWNKANMILKGRREKMSSEDKTSYQNKFLYSGKIICGKHKETYWRNLYKYDSGEKEIWQCKIYRSGGKVACDSPMLYKHELDSIMKDTLEEIFENKDNFYNQLVTMITKNLDDSNCDKDIKKIDGEINDLKKKKDKLLQYNIDGKIKDEEYLESKIFYDEEIEKKKLIRQQYESINDSKFNAIEKLKNIQKALDQKVDFSKGLNEKVASEFLDYIEIYGYDHINNLIYVRVILKGNIEVPVFYLVNNKDRLKHKTILVKQNMNLLQSIHMIDNKRMFKFIRNNNNQGQKPYEINYEVQIGVNLAS